MEPTQQPSDSSHTPRQWATPPRGELDRFANADRPDSYVEIGSLLSQSNRPSPVRSIAECVLANNLRPGTSPLPLFSALADTSSQHWREQVVAAWALARVPLSAQEREAASGMLLETLERDEDETIWERFLRGLLWGYGTMFPLCLIWSLLISNAGDSVEWADVFPRMLGIMGAMASGLTIPICLVYGRLSTGHNDLLRAASAESLGRLHVVEGIGPLAERLYDPSPTVREAAAYALMQMLPKLSDDDYGALDHRSVTRLADALNHSNTLLVLKILDALKKVGTGSSLPAVERLTRDGRTRQIQESARQAAAVLEERRRREREARHLMRPTTSPEQPADMLMRPSDFAASSSSLQVLSSRESGPHDWV